MRIAASVLVLALGYAALAMAGLTWAAFNGAVSPVWPAAGAAFAGLLLFGKRFWPAVTLGAVAAMALAGDNLSWVARLGIGLGNGLAAAAAVWLAQKLRIVQGLRQPRDFIVLLAASGVAAVVAATAGVAVLLSNGALPPEAAWPAWSTWALGDGIGVVTLAPLVLVWSRRDRLDLRRLGLILLSGGATALVVWLVFRADHTLHLRVWHIWPALIAAAVLARLQGAALAVAVTTALALLSVSIGEGPFPEVADMTARLLLLQQFVAVSAVTILLLAITLEDTAERQRTIELQRLVASELEHRIKNLLTVVQSISNQTLRSSSSLAEYREKFTGRLGALGRIHAQIVRGAVEDSDVRSVLVSTLEPLDVLSRVNMSGEPVTLNSKDAVALSLAAYELATNAIKYGALSAPGGRVDIVWSNRPGGRLEWTWMESGGPPVTTPVREGFGSVLIRQAFASSDDHRVDIEHHPEGLKCRITARLGDDDLPAVA